ncbi:MAG: LytTR family transcriptional regulator DNA-binding domain-containing protein [Flavobacteriales bacterium]|nr:LytTR family transcriptional regulator DNA-binding domain-containing protein [Flavobacteriales bacterium]
MSTTPARILIVEDEPLIAEDLAAMLEDLGHEVCGKAHDAATAVEMALGTRPEIALVDIRLGNGPDGVEVGAELQRAGIAFLYVTSHTDPATLERVATTRPQGFIIKPFDEEDLRTQLAIVRSRLKRDPDSVHADGIFVRDRGRMVKVPTEEILYAEADDNYTTLHTATRKYVLVSSLSAVEEKLGNPHLQRVHRKYAVDLRRVTGFGDGQVLIGTISIPVGRTHKEALKQKLNINRK